ncbi:MAG: serine/threonine-protein phosphatase [Ignavibacteria bacterium]|nr:serine/threonine-protein phosphatase [Ignavibacteria bacterium]
MQSQGLSQRSIYKIIDGLLQSNATSAVEILSALVTDIVNSDQLVMTGGRLWELVPAKQQYRLKFQDGEMEELELGLMRSIQEMPPISTMTSQSTLTSGAVSLEGRGDRVFSVTGVGDRVESIEGSPFPFVLAFTAKAHSEEFIDSMTVVGSAASTALRNMHAKVGDKRLQKDLDQAWQIQRDLVPTHKRTYNDYQLYGISIPDRIVGGDYFDYITGSAETDRLGVVISDAASKGLPAAVQALFVSGAIRMGSSYDTKMSALVSRLNTLIYDTFPHERFVSLCYCELLNSDTGLMLYVNAGHCPPIHYIAATGQIEFLQPTGGILGIISEQKFKVENINMAVGDVLVLYTDGITEALDSEGKVFGESRLSEVIAAHATLAPELIAQHILERVTQYSVGANYSDDKTLVVIRR